MTGLNGARYRFDDIDRLPEETFRLRRSRRCMRDSVSASDSVFLEGLRSWINITVLLVGCSFFSLC